MERNAQGAAEYLLFTALVVAVVLAVAVPALREAELTIAVSAARSASLQVASANALELGGMNYSVSASVVNVTPLFYSGGSPSQMPSGAGPVIADSIARVFMTSPDGQCVHGVSYQFCVG